MKVNVFNDCGTLLTSFASALLCRVRTIPINLRPYACLNVSIRSDSDILRTAQGGLRVNTARTRRVAASLLLPPISIPS